MADRAASCLGKSCRPRARAPGRGRSRSLWKLAGLALLAGAACLRQADPVLPTVVPTRLASPSPVLPISPTAPPAVVQVVPTDTPRPCEQLPGTLKTGSYRAVAVPGDLPYRIYLPPCFGEDQRAYPVLYLLHGYPYDEGHWLELGAGAAADRGIQTGTWLPFLMVMPLQPEPLFRSSDGGPGSYETELLEGIVAYIDRQYPTDPARRGLGGISRGGVWALEIGFRHPAEFTAIAALSPALAVNYPRPPYDPSEIARTAERLPAQILLLAGDQDWAAPATERLSRLLTAEGFPHSYLQVAGPHGDPTWAEAMPQTLDFLVRAVWAGP